MLFQQILVVLIAIGAVAYLTRIVIQSFQSDKSCEGACKCTPVKKVTPG